MPRKTVHHAYAKSSYCRSMGLTGYSSKRIEEVTCRICLKRIQKFGLKNREDFPEHPTFEVTPLGSWVKDGKDAGTVTFRCPVCGIDIYHGMIRSHALEGELRTPHCNCWEHDYYIKMKEEVKP